MLTRFHCAHAPQFKAYKYEDRLFINPVRIARACSPSSPLSTRLRLTRGSVAAQGSATGAYSPLRATTRPSFVLMDVDGTRLVAYVYQLVEGEVKVDKARCRLACRCLAQLLLLLVPGQLRANTC